MNTATITALISGLTALVGAVTALVIQIQHLRNHAPIPADKPVPPTPKPSLINPVNPDWPHPNG